MLPLHERKIHCLNPVAEACVLLTDSKFSISMTAFGNTKPAASTNTSTLHMPWQGITWMYGTKVFHNITFLHLRCNRHQVGTCPLCDCFTRLYATSVVQAVIKLMSYYCQTVSSSAVPITTGDHVQQGSIMHLMMKTWKQKCKSGRAVQVQHLPLTGFSTLSVLAYPSVFNGRNLPNTICISKRGTK